MFRVCLSGGSCGGKSTVLDLVQKEFATYQTFIVPETASEVMRMGMNREIMTNEEIQKVMFDLQAYKESMVCSVAEKIDNSLVFFDRGFLDMLAYIDRPHFDGWAAAKGMSFADVLNRYDLVIHLVSAAVGTSNYNHNNPFRFENREQAIEAERVTLEVNRNHPNLVVIDNSTGFEEKVQRVMDAVWDHLSPMQQLQAA